MNRYSREVVSLWRGRHLLWQLVRRDVATQYKGSVLGLAWSFVTPLMMLAIYTFVFSQVFGARWAQATGLQSGVSSELAFALNVFCGLIAFNLFAAVVQRASGLVIAHPNYVKKIVFPLALLPLMALGSALTQAVIAFCVLLAAILLIQGSLPWTALLAPLVMFPLIFMTLGLAWLLAALGVFLRDLTQLASVAVQGLLFLSPVFYPVSAVPKIAEPFFRWNPLAWVIEALRAITLAGVLPSQGEWLAFTAVTAIAALLCHRFFERVKHAFADVV